MTVPTPDMEYQCNMFSKRTGKANSDRSIATAASSILRLMLMHSPSVHALMTPLSTFICEAARSST